ncbi:MAG: N-6 DNA methylase [Thermosynechococcaceae cyanobacterium MS004]|nr:N-6 DNA methylase [Thermosynechococcaceae cyanobacterium MS004]
MAVVSANLASLQIEGNLIAQDLTEDLKVGAIKGQGTQDFGLGASEKLTDEIAIAWGDAKAYWSAFQRGLARLDESDTATTLTRDQWALPLLRSFGYDPFYTAKADVVDGKTYAISHRAGQRRERLASPLAEQRATQWEGSYDVSGTADLSDKPPLHIVGCRVGLEQRPPSGNPRLSAHALVQEYLNRTDHLWAVVTNGLRWRLLRDSSLMTRLSYVEFDLEQILTSENYADFCLFYRLFHRSRLPEGMEDADKCLLEFYHQESLSQGGRVRDRLRDGVEQALKQFGNGFLQHRDSGILRQAVESGEITATAYYRQLLLLIYRLLFVMVAESRNLLLGAELTGTELAEKSRIYRDYYSVERLRLFAERPGWRREGFQDMWQGLRVTFQLMDENWRGRLLGLSPLNGDLFGSAALKDLDGCAIDNQDLLVAIRHLSLYKDEKGQLRRINYAALDVEELGSVYESLLDFHPQLSVLHGQHQFCLVTGSDRKTTGSYYTPRDLVGQLIKSALEPVMAERLQGLTTQAQKELALLSLKVIDPACGSGHFLLAAARRLGLELARVRTEEQEPGDKARRTATRDVIRHCIYGVDMNPLAVDLCKVALWVEGFCQGYPLNFLNHRIKCGNSLVGMMDLSVLQEGIPDGAFKAIVGDSNALSSILKKRNKQERSAHGQLSVFGTVMESELPALARSAQRVGQLPEETAVDVHEKKIQQEQLSQDAQWRRVVTTCNLWTSAFFTPLTDQNLKLMPTTEVLTRYWREQQGQGNQVGSLTPIVEAANRLAQEKRFFHWPLEFPEVFGEGGFDCVLGNPPWDQLQLDAREFFESCNPEIANAQNMSARDKMISKLKTLDPPLFSKYEEAKHYINAQQKFIHSSDRFPLTSFGRINLAPLFTEMARSLIKSKGIVGFIVPTGIATDSFNQHFFSDLVRNKAIACLYDFENRNALFSAVHRSYKFSLFCISGSPTQKAKFSFFSSQIRHLENPARVFGLTSEDIALINPNTLTCPIFRTRVDAELTQKIYQRVPILENERTGQNPWGISFKLMFMMNTDSGLFATEPSEESVPLYEGKMLHQFDHRWATYNPDGSTRDISDDEKKDPNFLPVPRYWVRRSHVEDRLAHKWKKNWLIAFRDITNSTNERTAIFSILPRVGVGNKAPLILFDDNHHNKASCLLANFCSLPFDFVARQKIGGTSMNFFIVKQLPVLPPEAYSQADIDFITPRVLELVYTTWDMQPFAQDMGYSDDPFPWNPDRRAHLRAELDAYYAHLYGLTRDELRYILDPTDLYGDEFPSETFRVLKKNEINAYGEYRTQRLVLEAWDRLRF